jgi:hypothetical protein
MFFWEKEWLDNLGRGTIRALVLFVFQEFDCLLMQDIGVLD